MKIASVNIHLDYVFGDPDDPLHRSSSNVFCPIEKNQQPPPEFEYSGMTDAEIHHVVQLFATSRHRSYDVPLSGGQKAFLQRLKRFLRLIVRGVFKITPAVSDIRQIIDDVLTYTVFRSISSVLQTLFYFSSTSFHNFPSLQN